MSETNIPHPPVASYEEWRAARVQLLAREKEHTKEYDRINAERRRLPMVKIEKAYEFEGPEGKVSLLNLFQGEHQLIVYHFMFGPDDAKGCPGCTGLVNALGDLSMLEERDTRFVLISRAPLPKLEAYKKEKGWNRPWYSAFGSDFNYDFHATLDNSKVPIEYNYVKEADMPHVWTGEQHVYSVFFRVDEDIFLTYQSYARGNESRTDAYRLLDMTPYGRQEDFEDSPPGWPQKPTYG